MPFPMYKYTSFHIDPVNQGLYDPFTLGYGGWAFNMFGIPLSIMPEVVDSAGDHFGHLDASEILGLDPARIPISAVMADQSAAVFGSGCFDTGDTKITLGRERSQIMITGAKLLL